MVSRGEELGMEGEKGERNRKEKEKEERERSIRNRGDTVTEFNLVGMAASGMLLPPAG